MTVEFIGDGNSDGTNFGQAGEKIGFYGLTTPITKPAVTLIGTATATTALNETAIARTLAALRALGLISTDG
jgi:hypothetical protein|tara:strand:- start:10085 stop:10300 length:216 start_codon:yes stop_codon:yes gene_type:complete